MLNFPSFFFRLVRPVEVANRLRDVLNHPDTIAAVGVEDPQMLVEYVREHKLVIDTAVDFVGLQSTFDACFAVIRPGGTIHIAGLLADSLNALPLATASMPFSRTSCNNFSLPATRTRTSAAHSTFLLSLLSWFR